MVTTTRTLLQSFGDPKERNQEADARWAALPDHLRNRFLVADQYGDIPPDHALAKAADRARAKTSAEREYFEAQRAARYEARTLENNQTGLDRARKDLIKNHEAHNAPKTLRERLLAAARGNFSIEAGQREAINTSLGRLATMEQRLHEDAGKTDLAQKRVASILEQNPKLAEARKADPAADYARPTDARDAALTPKEAKALWASMSDKERSQFIEADKLGKIPPGHELAKAYDQTLSTDRSMREFLAADRAVRYETRQHLDVAQKIFDERNNLANSIAARGRPAVFSEHLAMLTQGHRSLDDLRGSRIATREQQIAVMETGHALGAARLDRLNEARNAMLRANPGLDEAARKFGVGRGGAGIEWVAREAADARWAAMTGIQRNQFIEADKKGLIPAGLALGGAYDRSRNTEPGKQQLMAAERGVRFESRREAEFAKQLDEAKRALADTLAKAERPRSLLDRLDALVRGPKAVAADLDRQVAGQQQSVLNRQAAHGEQVGHVQLSQARRDLVLREHPGLETGKQRSKDHGLGEREAGREHQSERAHQQSNITELHAGKDKGRASGSTGRASGKEQAEQKTPAFELDR